MKRLVLLLLVTLTIAGCVTTAKMDERMTPWREASLQQIIDAWGVPTKEQKVGDRHFLIWNNISKDSGVDIGISLGGAIGRNAGISISTLLGGSAEENVCSRVVEIDAEQKILGITWNGEPSTCFDVTPAREAPAGVN